MAIDQNYYRASLPIYFTDLILSTAGFALCFLWCLHSDGAAFALAFFLAAAFLYRAGAFVHELTHQHRNPRFKPFAILWNLTVGAVVLVPAVRFFHPHLIHHQVGVFGTRADPQYLMLRSDPKLAAFVLLLIPPIMPLYSALATVAASLRPLDIEGVVERYLARKGYVVGSVSPPEHQREITRYSRYHLAVFLLYAWFFSWTLPLLYAVEVAAWWMITLRVPLEHGMKAYRESSDARDHVIDSLTVESPFAELLQPLSLRLHTAHHMYPGVPYHNLPALHAELKRSDEEYRKSVVPFLTALRGPGWDFGGGR